MQRDRRQMCGGHVPDRPGADNRPFGGTMRMRFRPLVSSIPLLCLFALAAAAIAATPAVGRADITRFINEGTVVAAEADLTKLDGAAIEAFVMQLAKAAGVVGPDALHMKEAEAKAGIGKGTKWINDVKQAGATTIYLVMDSTAMQ